MSKLSFDNKKNFGIKCFICMCGDCHHQLCVHHLFHEDFYNQYDWYSEVYFTFTSPYNMSLWEKIKHTWNLFWNHKSIVYHDVVLEYDDIVEMRDFLNEYIKKDDEYHERFTSIHDAKEEEKSLL